MAVIGSLFRILLMAVIGSSFRILLMAVIGSSFGILLMAVIISSSRILLMAVIGSSFRILITAVIGRLFLMPDNYLVILTQLWKNTNYMVRRRPQTHEKHKISFWPLKPIKNFMET
ncbi:hypothetical protein CHS0354_039750 [Potamilus streckersoni]|uniref:Uncharacterized protein n=1 Tax=Potamilus streckersoni TaxID=2493646 RepID=A0AAE0RZZ3_9BIVA|nr:hypothetical protein CHS0354_039750 [Potamilus streckersoni]